MLLEELEQKPFEVIADEFVFAPLKLKNSFFASLTNLSVLKQNIVMATGYDDSGTAIPGKYPQVPDLAASGLWSTPTDLLVIAREFTRACNGESALLQAPCCRQDLRWKWPLRPIDFPGQVWAFSWMARTSSA